MLLKAMQVLVMLKFLIFFNPERQLKDIESTIESKLIQLVTQLKGFKFVTPLVSVFKKIESEDKTKYDTLYSSSKAQIMILMCFNQSILHLYQIYKNL